MNKIYYYGTNLSQAGHYYWELEKDNLKYLGLRMEKPKFFSPYDYPEYEHGEKMRKGKSQFLHLNGHSILAIEGSCSDNRFGTRSVFFIEGIMEKDKFIELLKSHKIFNEMVDQMNFEIEILKK